MDVIVGNTSVNWTKINERKFKIWEEPSERNYKRIQIPDITKYNINVVFDKPYDGYYTVLCYELENKQIMGLQINIPQHSDDGMIVAKFKTFKNKNWFDKQDMYIVKVFYQKTGVIYDINNVQWEMLAQNDVNVDRVDRHIILLYETCFIHDLT
jgi:hypothetical protein